MPFTTIEALLGDPSAIRRLGQEFAAGMERGGNAVGYSSANPTGAGVAGGRGGADEVTQQIRTSQLHNKVQKSIIKDYKDLSALLSQNNKKLKKATDDLDVFARVFTGKWNDVLAQVSKSTAVEQNLIKNTQKVMGGNITTLEDVLSLRQEMLELEEKIQKADGQKNAEIVKNIARYKKISNALNFATTNLRSFGTGLESLGEIIQGSIKTFFTYRAALANLSIAVVQLTRDFGTQLKFGSQMGLVETQMGAIVKGIDPGALSEMMGQARQVSIAFGDVGAFSSLLTKEQRKYHRMIGDTTDAHRFVTDAYVMLGKAGIKPVAGAMDDLGSTFAFLNQAAGVTSEQFTSLMEGMLQDTDISEQLRAAKEGERASIVAGIAKQVEMNIAMGMSAEQAFAAAKALGKISGETARERFKRAAQVQMVMGAMGIEGGGRAAELIRMGARINMVEGGRAELQGYMSQVADAAVTSKRGMIHQELVYDRLLKDLPEMGKGSDFVTTTASALKPQKEQLDKLKFEAKRSANTLEDMLFHVERIKNFLIAGALGKMMAGVVQLIGTVALTRIAGQLALSNAGGIASTVGKAGLLAKAGQGVLSMLPSGAAATMGTTVGAAGLGTTALGVGGAAVGGYAVGTAINNFAKLWGGRQLSTTILDAFTDFNDYDPNADTPAAEHTAEKTAELVEPAKETAVNSGKQLSVQEKQLEVMITTAELQAGAIDNQKALTRLASLDREGQSASTID